MGRADPANEIIFQQLALLLRYLMPELNYTSPRSNTSWNQQGVIRVGFLSAFFQAHASGYMLAGLVAALPRTVSKWGAADAAGATLAVEIVALDLACPVADSSAKVAPEDSEVREMLSRRIDRWQCLERGPALTSARLRDCGPPLNL